MSCTKLISSYKIYEKITSVTNSSKFVLILKYKRNYPPIKTYQDRIYYYDTYTECKDMLTKINHGYCFKCEYYKSCPSDII